MKRLICRIFGHRGLAIKDGDIHCNFCIMCIQHDGIKTLEKTERIRDGYLM